MITYIFTSNNFKGQIVNIQYSKYDSTTRIDLGSGTFPFEYTTDQKGGTYFFYIPSIDRTYPKNIDIPPIDIYIEEINVPECDITGTTIYVPPCDITGTTIHVPVCDIDFEITNITPTITPTPSITPTISCPQISGVTVGPIEISGGDYTLIDNPTNLDLQQFNTLGQYSGNIPQQSNSILPDSLFQDEIIVLVPSSYSFGGSCQYCFNINTGEQVPCVQVIPSQTPTPSVTNTPTVTPSITNTKTPTASVTPTPTTTPIPPFTILHTITDEDGYGIFGFEDENVGNKLYVFTSADTKIYSTSDYSVGNIISSFYSTADIINSIFEPTTQKIYVGQSSNSVLSSIEVSNRGIYPITLSGDVFGLTVDLSYNLVAVSSTYNPDGVSVIDSTTDFVNFEIDVVDNYKGGIASDNNGFCYVVGNTSAMTKIDIVNGVSADTYNIGEGSNFRRIIYNPNNQYLYIFSQTGNVKVFDSSDGSQIKNIDITSYNYNPSTNPNLIYNPNKNLIYISNVVSGTNQFGIITIDCRNDTVLNYTSNIYVGTTQVFMKYSNVGQRLYVGFLDDPTMLILAT